MRVHREVSLPIITSTRLAPRNEAQSLPADEYPKDEKEEAEGAADDACDHAEVLLQVQHDDPVLTLRRGEVLDKEFVCNDDRKLIYVVKNIVHT